MERGKQQKAERQLTQEGHERQKGVDSTWESLHLGRAISNSGMPYDLDRREDLSINEVKSCKKFEHLSNDEAATMINVIKEYTTIMYYWHIHQKNGMIFD